MEVRKIENCNIEPRKLPIEKNQDDQMQNDMDYNLAQKILKGMFENGLISIDEFNKITALNRQSFSPFLAELWD